MDFENSKFTNLRYLARTTEEMDGTLPRIASKIHSRGGSYYTPGLDGG